MAEYRLYFVDAEGRRTGCAEFSAIDDQSAQAEAQRLAAPAGGELWRGSHWMNTWAADGVRSVDANPLAPKSPSGNRQRAARSGWSRRRGPAASASSAREQATEASRTDAPRTGALERGARGRSDADAI